MNTQTTPRITDLLPAKHILTGFQFEDRDSVVKTMLRHVSTTGALSEEDVEKAWLAIQDRERKGCTAIGGGLALPHARIPFIDEPVTAFALLENGSAFSALDAAPVHAVFLMLSPESQPTLHLQALLSVSRIFHEPGAMEALRACGSAEDIFAYFSSVTQ